MRKDGETGASEKKSKGIREEDIQVHRVCASQRRVPMLVIFFVWGARLMSTSAIRWKTEV